MNIACWTDQQHVQCIHFIKINANKVTFLATHTHFHGLIVNVLLSCGLNLFQWKDIWITVLGISLTTFCKCKGCNVQCLSLQNHTEMRPVCSSNLVVMRCSELTNVCCIWGWQNFVPVNSHYNLRMNQHLLQQYLYLNAVCCDNLFTNITPNQLHSCLL